MKKNINGLLLSALLLNSSMSYSGVDGKAFENIIIIGFVSTVAVAAAIAGGVGYHLGYLGSKKETPENELERLQAQKKEAKEKISEIVKQNPHLTQKLNKHDSKL